MKRLTIRKSVLIPFVVLAIIAVFATIGALSDRGSTPRHATRSTIENRTSDAGSPADQTTSWGTPLPGDPVGSGYDGTGTVGEPTKAADGTGSSGGDLSMNYDFANLGPDRSRSLVRNGQISLAVDKGAVPGTVARIIGLTDSMGGYIVSTYMGTMSPDQPYPMGEPTDGGGDYQTMMKPTDGDPYAMITVRVPARNFDEAIARLSRLGTVEQLTTSSDDVTGQMIDLRARLRHFNAVEARLLGYLAQTTTISETLRVQDRLDEVQLQIEQLEGQLNAMDETVSFSMLSVSVAENDAVVVAAQKSAAGFTGRFMHSLRLIGHGAQVTFVAFGALIPFAVLAIVVGGILVLAGRRYGRNHRSVAPPAAPVQQALQP